MNAPKPTPTSITVSVRRCIQTRPYEVYEVGASITAEPDPAGSVVANVDRLYRALALEVDAVEAEVRNANQPRTAA